MKNAIDISRPIRPGMTTYPGDPPVRMERWATIGADAPCNLMELHMTGHCGTHLDAPAHFVQGGMTIDEIPLERLMTEALVVEARGAAVMPGDVPEREAIRGKAVLFRTRHSREEREEGFEERFVYLTEEAARALVERGASLVGIDTLGVDRYGDADFPAHRMLLGHGVLILEMLDLARAAAGWYRLWALPIKIAGGDGAPVRAVLIPADAEPTL